MDYSNKIVQSPYTFFDLKNSIKEKLLNSTLTRTTNIALPFIFLYRPVGNIISYGMSLKRIYSHLYEIKKSLSQNDFSVSIKPILLNAFEVSIVAGTVFRFKPAFVMIHSRNLVYQFRQFIKAIKKNDKHATFGHLLKMISAVINLSSLHKGSLKKFFTSLIFQALIQAYHGELDWKRGYKPESIAKFLMSAIKIYQSYNIYKLIQEKSQKLKPSSI